MYRTRTRILPLVAVAATMSLLLALSANAATMADMVGLWFGEIAEESTFGGEPYDMRRQIEDNRADGTKSVTFRFYKNCKFIGELINTHTWGVDNNVYWARCTSIVARGQTSPCFQLQEHDILSVTATGLSYKSKDSGTVYSHIRIGSDFKLPTSSCLSFLR